MVLGEDGNETLQAAEDGTVDHDGAGIGGDGLVALGLFGQGLTSVILELEALGKLEVELDGGTLVVAAEGVGDGDVNLYGRGTMLAIDFTKLERYEGRYYLWSIEGTISRIQLPLITASCSKLLQGSLQLVLGMIPSRDFPNILLRPGRELQLESKAKDSINCLQEIKETMDFSSDLHRTLGIHLSINDN